MEKETKEEQFFKIKFEFIGGREPIELDGMTEQATETIRSWFSRLNPILEIPVGKTLIMIDREKVSHIVIDAN